MRKNKYRIVALAVAGCLCTAYMATGLYTLQSGQRAVVLRFGKVVREAADAGVHYHLPAPIEQVVKVHVSEVQTVPIQTGESTTVEQLTGDENLIWVQAVIGYDVKNLSEYLFQIQDVERLIQATGQNCLSRELAVMAVDDVMAGGKSLLRLAVKDKIQHILDDLHTGVRIISVEFTEIAPPVDVAQAFKEVSDARVKKDHIIQEAEGYANTVIPAGRGKASSILSEARAYSAETLDFVNGRVSAFQDLLAEYQRHPDITAKLQYLQTIQTIYNRSQVILDIDSADSVYYIESPAP